MSHSRGQVFGPRSGATLFEALIVLAILGLVSSLAIANIGRPSPTLILDKKASEFIRRMDDAKLNAITSNNPILIEFTNCEGNQQSFTLFPNGTVSGSDLCINEAEHRRTLFLSPLLGRLFEKNIEQS